MFKPVMQDVNFGLRMLRKSPGFTIVAVLTLALGIGANTAVFTLVNAVLFKGLPYEDSDRILMVTSNNLAKNQPQLPVAYPDFLDMRAQSKAFKDLAAAQPTSSNISDPDMPAAQYSSGRISTNTFSLLGQKPLLGRDFLPEEDQAGGAQVVILGNSLWQSRYGGDPDILGRGIRLNELDFTVVGVMPEGVQFPLNQDLWIPLYAPGPASNLLKRETPSCLVYGRLADGATMAQAQAEMDVIAKRLEGQYSVSNEGRGARVMPYTDFFTGTTVRALFLAMLGAVGFVLLIACANVANLLLARSVARAREVSIRAALGASRGRIVRQLLLESALLSVLGGAAGLIIAIVGIRAFRAVLPPGVPYWFDFSLDFTVFAYLAAVCVATAVLFGLTPALQVTKVDLSSTLKDGARGSGGTRTRLLVSRSGRGRAGAGLGIAGRSGFDDPQFSQAAGDERRLPKRQDSDDVGIHEPGRHILLPNPVSASWNSWNRSFKTFRAPESRWHRLFHSAVLSPGSLKWRAVLSPIPKTSRPRWGWKSPRSISMYSKYRSSADARSTRRKEGKAEAQSSSISFSRTSIGRVKILLGSGSG